MQRLDESHIIGCLFVHLFYTPCLTTSSNSFFLSSFKMPVQILEYYDNIRTYAFCIGFAFVLLVRDPIQSAFESQHPTQLGFFELKLSYVTFSVITSTGTPVCNYPLTSRSGGDIVKGSVRLSVRPSVCPSVTLCLHDNSNRFCLISKFFCMLLAIIIILDEFLY